MVKTEVHAKWVRFLDADGQFKPIDTTLATTSDGWCMDQAPFTAWFPLRSSGAAVMHNNDRFNAVTKELITDEPLDLRITVPGADVEGHIEHGLLILSGKRAETWSMRSTRTYLKIPTSSTSSTGAVLRAW